MQLERTMGTNKSKECRSEEHSCVTSNHSTELTDDKLWDMVFTSSPTTAALALVILDMRLNGKISELVNKLKGASR